jgi:hypothetical protein
MESRRRRIEGEFGAERRVDGESKRCDENSTNSARICLAKAGAISQCGKERVAFRPELYDCREIQD